MSSNPASPASEGRPHSGYFVAAVGLGVAAVVSAVALGVLLYKQYVFSTPVIAGWAAASGVALIVSATWIACLISACKNAQKVKPVFVTQPGLQATGTASPQPQNAQTEESVVVEQPGPKATGTASPQPQNAQTEESVDADQFFTPTGRLTPEIPDDENATLADETTARLQAAAVALTPIQEWEQQIDEKVGTLQNFLTLYANCYFKHKPSEIQEGTLRKIDTAIDAIANELKKPDFVDQVEAVDALISYPCTYLVNWNLDSWTQRYCASVGRSVATDEKILNGIRQKLQTLSHQYGGILDSTIDLVIALFEPMKPLVLEYFANGSALQKELIPHFHKAYEARGRVNGGVAAMQIIIDSMSP